MTGARARDRRPHDAHRKAGRGTSPGGGCQETPPQPAASACLLAGIEAVLASPTHRSTTSLAEDLRAALARTAARGDTCRVPEAADSVRLAANLLLAGSPEAARQALRCARTHLVEG